MAFDISGVSVGSVLLENLDNRQQGSANCWCAVVECCARFWDIAVSQRSIHRCAGIPYGKGATDRVLHTMLKTHCAADVVAVSPNIHALSRELRQGHPVVAMVMSYDGDPDVNHVVVLRGLIVIGAKQRVYAVVNEPSFADRVSLFVDAETLLRSMQRAWAVRR